ncbi:MAG: hypothetical protein K6B13_14220 [Prevotella sp.]|nr:hypothetical protein [Prevotella sp.]
MRKRTLLLGLSLLAFASTQAQNAPWTGNALPAEGGTFYLYQVETGKWLQNNIDNAPYWTTRAELGAYGLDIEIVPTDDGYRLNPKFGHNHSINGPQVGDNPAFYLDTDQPQTSWQFTPVAGKENVYIISTDNEQHYLNANDEGWIDDFGFNQEWVLVTYEQRMADMMTATKANPKDATWLIGGHDFANQDERNRWDVIQEGDGVYAQGGDGIVRANRAVECWKKTKFELKKTITGLPNGTYEFKLQGFYRDGSEVRIGAKREAGEEEIRAFFFLNDVSRPFKSILESGVTEEDLDSYAVPQGGVYIPGNSVPGNALDRASNCFFKGGYWNDPVKVVVSDGSLTIGMQKIGGGDDDWLVFDNFTLTYLGNEIDLTEVKANLQAALEEATAYDGLTVAVLTNAIAEAQLALSGTDATAIAAASMKLRDALAAAKDYTNVMAEANAFTGVQPDFYANALAAAQAAANEADLDAFNEAIKAMRNALNDVRGVQEPLQFLAATIPFAEKAGVDAAYIDNAKAVLEHADAAGKIHDALNQLRVERKKKAADKHADVFKGATPADGDFYIYNVGLKRFLCGGGDWGAHAFVGFPGVEVTLISGTEYPENGDPINGFKIDTHLNNGGESEYLNYGGYMDTPTQNLWEFVPVEGKTGVYAIARANGEKNNETGERMLLGYRPNTYGNIDTDMYGIDNPENQWKLVTRAERDELLATATADKPQDATYKIMSPNFNQREDISAWISQYNNGSVWGRYDNHVDFAFECWDSADFDFSQNLYDLLPGWYWIGVQGYYRDGNHQDQIRAESAGEERAQAAMLVDMNTDNQVALPNILSEVDKAPGLGNRSTTRYRIDEIGEDGQPVMNEDGTIRQIDDPNGEDLYVGEFPMWINEACDYFQNGLYKSGILVQVTTGELMILVQKFREKAQDWVVVDNFRLTYYGTEKPSEELQGIADVNRETIADNRYYDLQGRRVSSSLNKGLYILNGRKVIIK